MLRLAAAPRQRAERLLSTASSSISKARRQRWFFIRLPWWTWVLIVLGVVATVLAYVFRRDHQVIRDWFPNLGAEILGIVVVLLLVESGFHSYAERTQKAKQALALRHLRQPLQSQGYLWAEAFKAVNGGEAAAVRIDDPEVREAVVQLDFSAKAPVWPERDWGLWLADEMQSFEQKVSAAVASYGTDLDPPLLALLEDLRDSGLVHFVSTVANARQLSGDWGLQPKGLLAKGGSAVDEFLRLFAQLDERYKASAEAGFLTSR